MAKIHNIDIGPNAKPIVWPQMTKLLNLMPRKFADPERDAKYKDVFPDLSELARRSDELKALLAGAPQPTVLCHNDVLLANIVLSRDGEQAHFIDYEYAGPNCAAYDIANHFNEWAGESVCFLTMRAFFDGLNFNVPCQTRRFKKRNFPTCLPISEVRFGYPPASAER
jgi:aminoglycoside phosphotransferase (APT) family kinase protein